MRPRALFVVGLVAALAGVAGALAWRGAFRGGGGYDDMPFEQVGDYRIGLATSPDPPRPGENVATIVVRDDRGRPVRGAQVVPRFVMEAMGQMPRMESHGQVREVAPGVYRATYGISMAGEWDVHLTVASRGGQPASGDWRVSTSAPGFAYMGGSGVAGVADAPAGGHAGHGAMAAAADDSLGGEVRVDAARRQALGIKVAPVERRELVSNVRAAGRVAWDETRIRDVTLKFAGFVRTLHADFVGREVSAGEPLLTVYSPELLAAQQEYLEALRAAATDPAARDLATAARRRLELWDIPVAQLEGIAREAKARDVLPVLSPVSGVVVEKKIVSGSPFNPGEVLFRVAPLHPIWVLASVYPMDLPLVKPGAAVTISNPYIDGGTRRGRVAFVGPTIESETRTNDVRVEVANTKGDLKPGMFVDVELDVALGRKLAVPESAVLPTGERRVVFVDLGDGRLAPREVRLGARAGAWYEVLSGLAEGERVVTSGNFLISSEAKLRSAGGKW
jgi:Cu(I)/Ag(I) efflux system membrane fusion protein